MEITIKQQQEKIKNLQIKSMDISQYESWNHEQIFMWIMSLENGRYKKYDKDLQRELKNQEITGDDLIGFDVNDLKGLGIIVHKDKKALLSSIKQLTNQNNFNNVNNAINEGAPTAYI